MTDGVSPKDATEEESLALYHLECEEAAERFKAFCDEHEAAMERARSANLQIEAAAWDRHLERVRKHREGA